jgi:hypothetical protein
MAGPIYKMFHARWTEAWYQLTQEQRDAMFAKMAETGERVGAKQVVICDSNWNSEKWLFWGVEEYPNMEAVQEYARCLAELEWFRYCDAEILLGTTVQPDTA